jgi:dienelactone hydrolase
MPRLNTRDVIITTYEKEEVILNGTYSLPENPRGIIIFAHGSGSGRYSPRNSFVSDVLYHGGFGSLLVDLLTSNEAKADEETREYRFDIELLTERLVYATKWLVNQMKDEDNKNYPIGYYGASTGAAAALAASVAVNEDKIASIKAIVSRGGRPDLAGNSNLERATAAILLLAGGNDAPTIALNQKALSKLKAVKEKRLVLVPGAGHLFEEKGTLEEVARHATSWFEKYLML